MPHTNVKQGLYWSPKTKTWHYEVRIGGRKYNGDTGCPAKALAAEFLQDFRMRKRRERDGLPKTSTANITLEQALEKWALAAAGSYTAKHIRDRSGALRRHFKPVLNLPLKLLDTDTLDKLRVVFLAGAWRSPCWPAKTKGHQRTVGGWNCVYRHLVALINWCIERDFLSASPFRGKPLKPQEKKKPIVWPEDAAKFLAIVESITNSRNLKTAIRLQLQLGLRENEALNARWEGFVERLGIYRPAKTKNRESRDIALPPGLLDYLRKHHGGAKYGLLLPGRGADADGQPLPHVPGYTREIVAKAGELMEIRGLHPHALRATFATAHWEAGTPLSQIMLMLGHKTPQTTMVYIHQRQRDATAAQHKVAKVMGLD